MQSYELYGFVSDNLTDLANHLGRVLGITLVSHESSYRGGTYYRFGMPGQEEFILQRNYDKQDQEAVELEFPDYTTLLYIGPTERSEEIKKLLTMQMKVKATLLRHRVL